jgi:hypothetical protein
MEEQNIKLRQEAAEIVIGECKQWLKQLMDEEMEKIREEIAEITRARLTVEQIAASFEEETRKTIEEEPDTITFEPYKASDNKKRMIAGIRS